VYLDRKEKKRKGVEKERSGGREKGAGEERREKREMVLRNGCGTIYVAIRTIGRR
jgi:hypothetical protein